MQLTNIERARPTFGAPLPGAWPTLAQLEANPDLRPGIRKVRVSGVVTVTTTEMVCEDIEVEGDMTDESIIQEAIEQSGISDIDDWDKRDFRITDIQ